MSPCELWDSWTTKSHAQSYMSGTAHILRSVVYYLHFLRSDILQRTWHCLRHSVILGSTAVWLAVILSCERQLLITWHCLLATLVIDLILYVVRVRYVLWSYQVPWHLEMCMVYLKNTNEILVGVLYTSLSGAWVPAGTHAEPLY